MPANDAVGRLPTQPRPPPPPVAASAGAFWASPFAVRRPAHFGVLPRVLSARKRAFSAPRIWTVDAGYLARLVKLPACEMSRAATWSPMSDCKLGATRPILVCR